MHVNLSIPSAVTRLLRPRFTAARVTRRVAIPGYFLRWLGIPERQLSAACNQHALQTFSYLDAAHGEARRWRAASGSCPDELRDTVTYATCVATDSLPAELDATHAAVEQMWRQKIAKSYAQVVDLFERRRPAVVLLVQGFEPHNAVARCVALRLGIPLVAIENTAIASRMVWDNVAGITTNRNIAKSYYWRYKDREKHATCDSYCQRLIQKTKQLKSDEHRSPAALNQPSSARPTVLFLGQVYTDSSQVFGLRQWVSPLAVLQSCVQWCQQHRHNLVVKLHPKEKTGHNPIDDRPYDRLTYRKIMQETHLARGLQDLSAIIDTDNSYDTYDLINNCVTAVTVNSQAGLEAAIRGKPVVVCGDAFYAGLDFTCDAPGPGYFDSAMQAAGRSGSENTARARQFTYIFFEQYCRAKNVQTLLQLIQENVQTNGA